MPPSPPTALCPTRPLPIPLCTSKACTGMVLALRMDGCSGAGRAVELMSCRAFRAWSREGQPRSGDMRRAGAMREIADGIRAKAQIQG